MPYIAENVRVKLDRYIGELNEVLQHSAPGNMNYVLTSLIVGWLTDRGLTYGSLNEVVGVLECVKLELYRRVVAAYEDKKCLANGDVYPPGWTQPYPNDGKSPGPLDE